MTFDCDGASDSEPMKFSSKALVLTLAMQVAASSVMMHAELWPSAESRRPGGCHGNRQPQAPQPKPNSFACCLGGHDSALLQMSTLTVPACDAHVQVSDDGNGLATVNHSGDSIQQIISSGDPPGRLPLRI